MKAIAFLLRWLVIVTCGGLGVFLVFWAVHTALTEGYGGGALMPPLLLAVIVGPPLFKITLLAWLEEYGEVCEVVGMVVAFAVLIALASALEHYCIEHMMVFESLIANLVVGISLVLVLPALAAVRVERVLEALLLRVFLGSRNGDANA